MLGGDPALVESTGLCAAGDGRAVGTNNGDLVGGVDLLGLAGGALGALAALAAALLLGEESGDPSVVDEVAGTGKDTAEDEVEEDAAEVISTERQWINAGSREEELTSEGRRKR